MAIPKNIFQTFKTSNLPWITRFYIWRMKSKNPNWTYHFYDDEKILDFFKAEYSEEFLSAYESLTIGAAKADFFRYAILYKKGGVYLDIDGYDRTPLDRFITPSDKAVISNEGNPGLFCQYALIFDKEHPFLKRTLEKVLDNIQTHRFPNDVHRTTGPTVFTESVNEIIKEEPNVEYRILGTDYNGHLKFKYKLGRIFLYGKKSEHWKRKQLTQDIIKPK